jgi:hypothetical protein
MCALYMIMNIERSDLPIFLEKADAQEIKIPHEIFKNDIP